MAVAAGVAAVIAVAGCSSGAASDGTSAPTAPSAPAGIDNGAPGSACKPLPTGLTSPAEPGTRAGSWGGDYYELGEPIPRRRQAPLMLILHGGGWFQNGPGMVQSVRALADLWRHQGWRTLNSDYHACASSVGDVVGLYDHFRKLANGQAICALGESAGGHLALMLAAERPELRCAIGFAAPVDLPALPAERTSGTLPGQPTSSGPHYVYNLALAAFGARELEKLSPALQAQRIKARVLLAVATDDVLIPFSQLRAFARRRPSHTRIMQVPPGSVRWVHGTTTAIGIQQVAQAAFRVAAGLR